MGEEKPEEYLKKVGHPSLKHLVELGYVPDEDRLRRGPVAIFECVEPIPCNVCVFVCPFKAVEMKRITDLPKIDFDKCTGCTVCVGRCPGQAIFIVDFSKPGDKGTLILQYDLQNPPRKGESVILLDREGREIGEGEVTLVYREKTTGASVVYVNTDKKILMEARAIRRKGG